MYGIMLVKMDSGLIEQPFGISRKTITDKIKNNSRNYYYGTESEVINFKLQFMKFSPWTYEQRVRVTQWFFYSGYKDFISEDFPLVYKIIGVGEPKFYNNGNNEGYLEIEFETDQPYAYSPVEISSFDLSDNVSTTIITAENKSNVPDFYYYNPEIQIELLEGVGFVINNLTDGNREFSFSGLTEGEVVYCNCETGLVYSTLNNTRLSNLSNKQFLRLKYGVNNLMVAGKVNILFRMQYPMMV